MGAVIHNSRTAATEKTTIPIPNRELRDLEEERARQTIRALLFCLEEAADTTLSVCLQLRSHPLLERDSLLASALCRPWRRMTFY